MKLRIFAVLAAVGLLAGCGGKAAPPAAGQPPAADRPPAAASTAAPAGPHLAMPDACTLLTVGELAEVIGGPVEQRYKVPDAKGHCRWDGQHGALQIEINDGENDPHGRLDAERAYHETAGDTAYPVSGIGDGALLITALNGTLLVARANLMFSFSYLGLVPEQAGKTDLIPAWRKALTLAVSRAG